MSSKNSSNLRNWLATYDPIYRGWTLAGIANGLCATNGFFFPRVRGGYNLYRTVVGEMGVTPELVGAADADANQVQTFSWVRHAPATQYTYRLVPVGGGGIENWADDTQTAVHFSETGLWVGPLPNAPSDLNLLPLSNGRIAVRWSYYPQGQQTAPVGFSIYKGTGHDEIDYGSTESDVPYRPGQVHYEYITMPQADGTRSGWAVRAYSASYHEEQNLERASILARASGPPGNPTVKISVI